MLKLNLLKGLKLLIFQKSFIATFDATVNSIATPKVAQTKYELYQSLMMLKPNSPKDSKVLKISVLGCPNSGKSTLVNMLTKWKVCAVSGRVNTTRSKQTVVLTKENVQLCFIDLPGVINREKGQNYQLEKSLIRDPHVGIFESDLVICVIDVTHKGSKEELNIELLKALHFFRDKQTILVLNKIDRMAKKIRLFDITKKLTDGVIGGKVSHKDRYAYRFRKDVPTHVELMADQRITKLLAKHNPQSLLESKDTTEDVNDESSLQLSDSEVKGKETTESDNEYAESSEMNPNVSRRIEVESEMKELMKILYSSENGLELNKSDMEIDDQILDVLKTQLMLKSASKGQIAERREKWRQISEMLNQTRETCWKHFDAVFPVSSATGQGIDQLRDYLIDKAKPGQWHFHSSLITDRDPEALVRMSVWASCLSVLEKEIPYKLNIKLKNYEQSEDGSLHIFVVVQCRTSRELMAVIGTKGDNISTIADQTREQLEQCFQANVYLKIVAQRQGVASEHLKRMRGAKDFRDLYPKGNTA